MTKPVRPSSLSQVLSGRNNIVDVTDIEVEPEVRPDRRTYSVLLAEDNPFNQKVAVGLLKRLGCEVAVAANGVEALDLAAKHDFDLVFMDCQMPEMDGYEATRRIRRLEGERRTVPIVAMTANALSGDRQACYAAGMDDFLSKPINKAMIDEMLIKWERTPQDS